MLHPPPSPEVIVAIGLLVLIILLFIGMLASAIYSLISEDKTDSKSGSKTKPNS